MSSRSSLFITRKKFSWHSFYYLFFIYLFFYIIKLSLYSFRFFFRLFSYCELFCSFWLLKIILIQPQEQVPKKHGSALAFLHSRDIYNSGLIQNTRIYIFGLFDHWIQFSEHAYYTILKVYLSLEENNFFNFTFSKNC